MPGNVLGTTRTLFTLSSWLVSLLNSGSIAAQYGRKVFAEISAWVIFAAAILCIAWHTFEVDLIVSMRALSAASSPENARTPVLWRKGSVVEERATALRLLGADNILTSACPRRHTRRFTGLIELRALNLMGIDPRYLCALRSTTTNVRNFCIIAHVDHGTCRTLTARPTPAKTWAFYARKFLVSGLIVLYFSPCLGKYFSNRKRCSHSLREFFALKAFKEFSLPIRANYFFVWTYSPLPPPLQCLKWGLANGRTYTLSLQTFFDFG